MAEAVLGMVTEALVRAIRSVIWDPFCISDLIHVLGIKEKPERPRESSILVQAMLQDIKERQLTKDSLKHWLDLNDKVLDAEDVIDEFVYEGLRRKVEIRNQMKKKIQNNRSLEELKKKVVGFGLRVASFNRTPNIGPNQEIDSFLDQPQLIKGREVDISKVINLLIRLNNQQALLFVPMVGMPGIRKTTLAKLVFDAVEDGELFDETIWVSVSDD